MMSYMAYPLYNREKQVERSSSEGASERHYEIFDKFFSIKIQFPHREPKFGLSGNKMDPQNLLLGFDQAENHKEKARVAFLNW